MKILVCDDDAERSKEVVAAIAQGRRGDDAPPSALLSDALRDALDVVFARARDALANPTTFESDAVSPFDDVDLVLFDNNLAHLHKTGARLTAEEVIGYVRAFTSARYIVSLNKNPDVDFDLRYLVGDFDTRADLALNTEHLRNPALWSGDPKDAEKDFCPWYWPALNRAGDLRAAQVAMIQPNPDASVFATIGFPTDPNALAFLSHHAKGALYPLSVERPEEGAKLIQDVTFRDVFIAKTRSLPVEDERKDLAAARTAAMDDVIARVVAADLELWFRRDVVGPQELLVDAPHLATRMPVLLGEKAKRADDWNRTAADQEPPFGFDGDIYEKFVAAARYSNDAWTHHAAFWWPSLKANDELSTLFFNSVADYPDVVFCEDRSGFVVKTGGEGDPVDFLAEFESSWARRYVAKIGGFKYLPLSRFMM